MQTCSLCQQNILEIDFKDTRLLKRYISALGKIKHRKKTGLCAFHQRKIALAIKRARFLGLLPFVVR